MGKLVVPSKGLYRTMFLVLALVAALFILSSTAHAQEQDPMDNQYQPAVTIEGSGDQGSTPPGNSGSSEAAASSSAGESSNEYGTDVLPATGGPLLPLLALGALALGATGLLVSRRNR